MSETGPGRKRPSDVGGNPASTEDAAGAPDGNHLAATLSGVVIASLEETTDPAGREDGDERADADLDAVEGPDWAWVAEWRESGEPPAWAPGITVATFTAIVVGLAVFVLSDGLAGIPWLAVAANILIAAGLAPALWLSRRLPVLRWISAGAAIGVVLGWIGALAS